MNRSSLVTVLDHLDALEDGEALEDNVGLLEEELERDTIPYNDAITVDYTNDDFDSLTTSGLPHTESFEPSNLEIIGNSMKILNYYDVIGKDVNPMSSLTSSLSETLGLDTITTNHSSSQQNNHSLPPPPPVAVVKAAAAPQHIRDKKPFPPFIPNNIINSPDSNITLPPNMLPPVAPPIPIQQPITFAKVTNINDVKPAKYMSRYDMKYVIYSEVFVIYN